MTSDIPINESWHWQVHRSVLSSISLWGARHPGQLDPIDQVFGWSLTDEDLKDIDEIIRRDIPSPVGPEFMAPPSRDLGAP